MEDIISIMFWTWMVEKTIWACHLIDKIKKNGVKSIRFTLKDDEYKDAEEAYGQVKRLMRIVIDLCVVILYWNMMKG